MTWILFQPVDTPRDNKTNIEWLDAVLALANEITARIIQEMQKEGSKDDTILLRGRRENSKEDVDSIS